MTKRRRFFIFFASAGLMSLFLLFSLSVRPDDPLKKWSQWLPSNKVKTMIMDRELATGTVVAKEMRYTEEALAVMECEQLSKLEVRHNLRDAEIFFSHEKTNAQATPKLYYLEETIHDKAYFAVVAATQNYSKVVEFGSLEEGATCK